PYSGMLPGLIAGHYGFDEAHIDLAPLTRFAKARFVRASVTGIDTRRKIVHIDGRPPFPYDVLSINSGSTPSMADVTGASEFAVPVKPISQFLTRWRKLKQRIDAHQGRLSVAVVGGGAGGVELALAAQHALRAGRDKVSFRLLTADEEILCTHPPRVAKKFRRILSERGVEVQTGTKIVEIRNDRVVDDRQREFEADETLWVAQAGAPSWLRDSGVDVDDAGFLAVDECLRSTSDADIFGAGDVAAVLEHPRPKAGVFAVRQGRPLQRNLRRALLGRSPVPFRPQSRFLSLISTGDQYAVASRGFWSAEGAWVWRWKDRIDRRFMRRYQELPEMDAGRELTVPPELVRPVQAQVHDDGMRCGGCGAKIAADVLSEALTGLRPVERDDVLVGLNAPDDAALIAQPEGKITVHSIDAFRPMLSDPWLFGRITANHCLGDVYAMGAEPQSAMTIATLPVWPKEKLIAELRQMLLGALFEFDASGTALVGGHTSEGAEISLGFAVTGLIEPDLALHKTGLSDGDALIVTKPVGTGTILAADMRARAHGRWVDAAIDAMLTPNLNAGRILRSCGATACTDITGFGVAGHLLEMLGDSELAASIDLARLPTLPGAQEAMSAGLSSSLQPDNERFISKTETSEAMRDGPLFRLLFDPQTAGGLLAGVPRDNAESCLNALRAEGYPEAARIGEIVRAADGLRPLRVLSG
ncbi:MAG TPA: selenide, water dikinase SelD, partial [Gammaproteobacteria bacterium]